MTEELISGLIGAIAGALIGFIASLLTLRFNYHQLFASTVSSNRMEWINVWRENISKFLACAEILHTKDRTNDNEKELLGYEKELLEARAMIITRLNTKENDHVLMYGALTQIDYSPLSQSFYAQQTVIIELARKILKPEWERVKNEAKGKRK